MRFEPLEDRRLLAVVTVNSIDDIIDFNDGVISLREAIFATNTVPGPDTVEFAESLTASGPATILLTLGELAITDALTINGPGADLLTIDAAGNGANPIIFGDGSRIFNIDDGNSQVAIDVTIAGLKLTGGDASQYGGAILSRERLFAHELVIMENQAILGGALALFAPSGESLVSDCTIVDNEAASQGGAFYVQGSSSSIVTIRDNTISENTANRGGALYAGQAPPGSAMILAGNIIEGNSALQQGGAIYLVSLSAPKTTIRSSTLSGNTAGLQGGALFATGVRDLTIIDSQLVGNKSLSESPSLGRGGAIYATNSDFAITGSTISGNMAMSGGGINSRDGEAAINFSTVAENVAIVGNGGGIYSNLDRLSIVGSTISGNTATGRARSPESGSGGGLWHSISMLAPSTILDTRFSENAARYSGGGAHFRAATTGAAISLALINSSFSENTAARGGGIALGDQGRIAGSVMIDGGSIDGNSASLISGTNAVAQGGGVYGSGYSMFVRGTTITGNHADGNGGGIATSSVGTQSLSMSFVGATIAHNSAGSGLPQGTVGFGGGIYIPTGTVFMTLLDTDVSQNSARVGGGIARGGPQQILGSLTAVDSTISGNTSLMHGAGVYNFGGLLSFTRSTIANNVAGATTQGTLANGGGIFSRFADVTLVESSLTGNSSLVGRGGGLYLSQPGDLTITSSTIAGNSARQDGGGIWGGASGGRAIIQSSTISGNSSMQGTGGLYLRGIISVRHSTVTKNTGGGTRPGGLLAGDGAQQLELDHTIVAGNSHATGGPADIRFVSSPTSATIRASLIGDNTSTMLVEAPLGSPDANGNLIGKPVAAGGSGVIAPLLAPLANNGGPTLTHALLPGSPALDGGVLVTSAPQGFDQRGKPHSRMVDGTGDGVVRIDIGAYESPGVPSFTPGDYSRDGIVDACDYSIWRDTMGSDAVPFAGADGNGDGIIDSADYNIWKSHFGDGLTYSIGGGAGSALAATSEPAALAVIAAAPSFLSPTRVERPAPFVRQGSGSDAAGSITSDAILAWLATEPRRASAHDNACALESSADEAEQADSNSIAVALDAVFAGFGA